MPTAKRELALAAALVKLQGITGVTGLTVERNRRDPVEDFPAIVLRDGGHSVSQETIAYDLTTIQLDVELYVRAAAGENYGTKLNELYGKAKAAMLADLTLTGTAQEVRETGMSDPDIDTSDSSTVSATAAISFEIDVWGDQNSPY